MYRNSPFYNNPYYQQDWTKPPHQPTSINQTFQLSPNQSISGVRFVNDINDVKNTLVFGDTFFINKDFNMLWRKNNIGEIKSYSLEEIVEQDEKDQKIAELEAKIASLEKERKSNESTGNASTNNAITTNSQS